MSGSAAIQEMEQTYTSGVYTKRPLAIVRGSGAKLWDADGREYIDCVGGHGSANIGHAHPRLAQAIAEQAQRLIVCPEIFHNDRRAELAERLCRLTDMGSVFFCNSGAEAVEAAFKFARLLSGRREIIAAMRGFHGRTMGALSATWEKKYRAPFEPLVPHVRHVPYNDLAALEQAVGGETAAVILEVVQGEGGVNPASGEYLRAAQALCRQRGALFILDEVQTGFGRTGRMFAYQHHGVQPHILCAAKSIAGGVPMGAALLRAELGKLPAHVHGSTFGGSPLACAAALAALDVIEQEDLPRRAQELGEWFRGELMKINSPLAREVRGLGLMVGVELRCKAAPYLQALMARGVLALPAGATVLRFLPPLVITRHDLQKVVQCVESALSETVSISSEE